MEQTIAAWVFWLSAAWFVYTYFGHAAFLFVASKLRPRPWKRGTSAPGVSIYVAAFNEAAVIQDRIETILQIQLAVIANNNHTEDNFRLR